MEVEALKSAFLVKTLLAIEGDDKAPIGPAAPLRWKGEGDRFRVGPGPWATYPGAPVDLGAWIRLTGESDARSEPLKLAKEPPDPANPPDCALVAEDGKPVGADPSQWSGPSERRSPLLIGDCSFAID